MRNYLQFSCSIRMSSAMIILLLQEAFNPRTLPIRQASSASLLRTLFLFKRSESIKLSFAILNESNSAIEIF
ncbi:hypothetical protein ES319_D09G074000v1 [Gossypium barbadense]|uniref:Uncharacterized protein n=2 Tax=Gossypium TaxID=3633 RepID=A0A0D2RYU3_GOSRA|nr:hypothetical protein ES319_D09G074000v1 [Gossypium barbadense]KJB34676.1 hypothetical protein B456_006G077800 [Gossypium raimondii]